RRLGRITTGGTITEYSTGSGLPACITLGPDRRMWFTFYDGDQIGRITYAGVIRQITIPTPGSNTLGITSGPDHRVWFDEFGANNIGALRLRPPPPELT